MKSRQLFPFLIAGLVVANIVLLLKLNKSKQSIDQIKKMTASQIENEIDLEYDLHEFSKYDSLQFASENKPVNKKVRLRSLNGTITTLEEVISDSTKLVFRYSELNCNTCYQKVLDQLNVLINLTGRNKVIVITSYNNQRELFNFMRANNLTENVYNIGKENLGLAVENYDTPFLFILDKTFKTKLLYVPIKKHPEISVKYFEVVAAQL